METKDRRVFEGCRVIAVVLAAAQALSHSMTISALDGISYIEVGEAYFQGNWETAVNAYWSPLYSALLGLILSVLHPSPFWEFSVVKLTNFLIFLFVLFCFEFFLKNLMARMKSQNGNPAIPETAWISIGYSLFLYASLRWIGVHVDSPDLLSSGFVYLSLGILLTVDETQNRKKLAGLGVALGFGYLSKAVLLPLGAVVLVLTAVCLKSRISRVWVPVTSFLIVAAPFMILLSAQKERITFGDSGKLNYAWFVNPVYSSPNNWQGEAPGFGDPVHPTRKICDRPVAYEFLTPVGGTYPPWHDPSYWWEGLVLHFDLQKQLRVLIRNASFYWHQFALAFLSLLVLVAVLRRNVRTVFGDLMRQWIFLIPALCGLGLYFVSIDMQSVFHPAHPSTRYIASFLVLLFLGLFAGAGLKSSRVPLAASLVVIGLVSFQITRQFIQWMHSPQHMQWEIAEGLKAAGIQSGDRIAILGDEDDHVVWARLARVRIIAQIPDEDQYRKSDSQTREQLLAAVDRTGASAVVSGGISDSDSSSWGVVTSRGYAVHDLR